MYFFLIREYLNGPLHNCCYKKTVLMKVLIHTKYLRIYKTIGLLRITKCSTIDINITSQV